jgi:hypothetical protein
VVTTASYSNPSWITALAGSKISGDITGNAANVTGTVAVANGGTGQTTYTNGQLLIGNSATGGLNKAGITAGSGISVTTGNGTITIAATGSSGTVTSVDGSGGTTGLSLSGGPITTSGTLTLGGTLAVANGGTGSTTAADARTALSVPSTTGGGASGTWGISVTGTAASVPNGVVTTSSYSDPTWITSLAGSKISGDINNATINGLTIGFRSIPRSTTSGTAAVGDVGRCIAVTAGITIPNATFAAGDAVSIYNDSASAVTITQGASLTLRLAGTTTTGNRTLAARGMATIWFNSGSEAVISGAGVS